MIDLNNLMTSTLIDELNQQEINFIVEYVKDYMPRRAAIASGYSSDDGYRLVQRPAIAAAITMLSDKPLVVGQITPDWLLMQAVDNHYIARQAGNISASNVALTLLAKHVHVDAFAADKTNVNLDTSKDVIERLLRARDRNVTMRLSGNHMDEDFL